MRITELARRGGVTVKAVRYYESIGLLTPGRSSNGYRSFDERDLRIVAEIRELGEIGIPPGRATPFIECLDLGHDRGDDCVSSLAVYRDTIAEVDSMITSLTARRERLQQRLDERAAVPSSPGRLTTQEPPVTDFTVLPDNLPVPENDGAADHLPGMSVPDLTLPATDGSDVNLAGVTGRSVLYLYPLTGEPGKDLPDGWDAIPGARGCSTEACDFRDHFTDLQAAGANRVFGLSSQTTTYQADVVTRLNLPFPMLSDETMALADTLTLPTFSATGHDRLYSRITLILRGTGSGSGNGTVIEHVFYPIFPPNTHAQQVLAWLKEHPATD